MNDPPLVTTTSRQPAPTDLRPYFRTVHDLDAPLDWPTFFGNERPVELDIGCGRGLFLVRAGEANPDRNYLGLEIDYREGRRGAKRLQRRNLENVRVIGGDARIALSRFMTDHSVDGAHVYFPDPWWKKKHRRRRLFTDEFANQIATVLKPGGLLHSWTDVGDYFEVIEALVDHHPCFEKLEPSAEHMPTHDMDYQTSYERKRRKAGCTIHRGLWRRRQLSPKG